MAQAVPLELWSEWLLEEIFADEAGDGRPVTTFLVDDALLVRALAKGNIVVTEREACQMFIKSFPRSKIVLEWFDGGLTPGKRLVAFLVLCCYAASESAGNALNDYRKRLRELMGWSEQPGDCSALPRLWTQLQEDINSSIRIGRRQPPLRPLVLPNPRHRTQIGHAVELTFPSRPDARRLQNAMKGKLEFDTLNPRSVLAWLHSIQASSRFTTAFQATLDDFDVAFRRGERALADHRFWLGWTIAIANRGVEPDACPIAFVRDEWGDYEVFDDQSGEPTNLGTLLADRKLPHVFRLLLKEKGMIFLREAEQGRWRWAGSGLRARQSAGAAVIPEVSVSKLGEQLRCSRVVGMPGWAFTRNHKSLVSDFEQRGTRSDDLLDLTFSGVPRIEGGRLGRPTFPIVLTTSGPAGMISLSGEKSEHVMLTKAGPNVWVARLKQPLQADIGVRLRNAAGEGHVDRILRLRSSALAPDFDVAMHARYQDDELSPPQDWRPTWSEDECARAPAPAASDATHREVMRPEMADLLEFLATSTGQRPLGEFMGVLTEVLPAHGPDPWDVLRALFEGGVLRPLRVRGWRGRAVMPLAPRLVLMQEDGGWRLTSDGLFNEVQVGRLSGIAERRGLTVHASQGLSPWAVVSHSVSCRDLGPLSTLAGEAALPLVRLRPDLGGLTPFSALTPNANGATHTVRREAAVPGSELFNEKGIRLYLCSREQDDAPKVWLLSDSAQVDRYWNERHFAILDACQQAGVAAFERSQGVVRAQIAGAYLPLPIARWSTLFSGLSSGPTEQGYLYPCPPSAGKHVYRLLGSLVADASSSFKSLPGKARTPFSGHPILAHASASGCRIDTIWRWARSNRAR